MKARIRNEHAGSMQMVFLIFLLSFLIRLALIDTSFVFWDEAIYLMDAQALDAYHSPMDELSFRPVLLPLILKYTYHSELMSRVLMVFLNSLFIPLLYATARRLCEKAGIIAAVIAAVFPFHIMASQWIMTDALSSLLILACFNLTSCSLDDGCRGRRICSLLSGVSFGLSVLMKFTSLFFAGVLLLMHTIHAFYIRGKHTECPLMKNIFPAMKYAVFSAAGFAFVMLPFFLMSHVLYGSPFHILMQAFSVVDAADSPGAYFIFRTIAGFGTVLWLAALFSVFGIAGERRTVLSYLWLWLLFGVLLFIWAAGKGVAKPELIPWEPMRFLLPVLAPAIILSSYALSRLKWRFVMAFIVIFLALDLPMIKIMLEPRVMLESGLRDTAKEMGLFIRDNDMGGDKIYCLGKGGNCPPVAYYSGKSMTIARNSDDSPLNVGNGSRYVVFSEVGCSGYLEDGREKLIKGFYSERYSSCLYEAG